MKSPKRLLPNSETAETVDGGRRSMFALAAAVPLFLLGIGSRASAANAPACFDPNALPANQRSMRRTIGFQLRSADPNKRCGNCAFFSAPAGNCGKCALLGGGAVTTTSGCTSWALKR